MKSLNLSGLAFALLTLFATQAQALTLTPDDCVIDVNCWTSDINSNPNAATIGTMGGATDLTLLYKSEFGGGEEGVYAGSYDTTFSGTVSDPDPSAAYINYLLGSIPIDCTECYLSIKGGNSQPSLYVFDISGWDGEDFISLSGFWEDTKGAISNIAIWGPITTVPAPATLGLLGLGLILLAVTRSRV